MSEAILYYPLCIQLDKRIRCFLWYSQGDDDRFVLDEAYRLRDFDSLSELSAYAASTHLMLNEESPPTYDFDRLAEWLAHSATGKLDCRFLLDTWNLIIDAVESVGSELPSSPETIRVRELLFWGCNLPAVTPSAEHFDPEWTDDEVAIITEVLIVGLREFRQLI